MVDALHFLSSQLSYSSQFILRSDSFLHTRGLYCALAPEGNSSYLLVTSLPPPTSRMASRAFPYLSVAFLTVLLHATFGKEYPELYNAGERAIYGIVIVEGRLALATSGFIHLLDLQYVAAAVSWRNEKHIELSAKDRINPDSNPLLDFKLTRTGGVLFCTRRGGCMYERAQCVLQQCLKVSIIGTAPCEVSLATEWAKLTNH